MTKRVLHNALFVAIITNNREVIVELLTFFLHSMNKYLLKSERYKKRRSDGVHRC